MVEFKGPGNTSRSYNNIFIIIPTIIIIIFVGFVVYRLSNNLISRKRQKEEKSRLKQQKRLERQSLPTKSKRK